MKLTYVHAAAAAALIFVAYTVGKKRASIVATSTAQANIQAPADWWSYAGMWSAQ